MGEKSEVSDEKQYSNNIHSAGTDRPPWTAGFNYYLSIPYLHTEFTGNLTIITLTIMDSHLKTPMYFFLKNFSFLEISFTSCIPRYLYSIATGDRVITYNSCALQVIFTDLCGITEFFMLATMSYDRYVAICKPLHYVTIMSNRVCRILIISCWMAGLCVLIPSLSLGLNLKFCDSNKILAVIRFL